MEYADTEWEIDEDYSSSKQSEGKVNWMIDKGLWLGKKAVITGAVISSAPLVLPPLMVFSTLGFACSVPFGLVFASYACTQKIMSTLLPVPESSSMLEYDEIDDDLVQEVDKQGYEEQEHNLVHEEKQGYEEQEVDLAQEERDRGYEEEYEVERIDLVQEERDRGYEKEYEDKGVDLVQEEKDQGYEEDDEAEDVDLVQVVEMEEEVRGGLNIEIMLEAEVKEEMKDMLAAIEGGDILEQSMDGAENDVENREEEKQIGTTRQTVKSTEQGGGTSILPAGAALLQEDVRGGLNLELMSEAEVKEEMKDKLAAIGGGDILEQSMDRGENDVENQEEEKQIDRRQTVKSTEQGGRDSSLLAGAALLQEDGQGNLNIEIMLEAEVKEEMKDTLAAIEGGDILEQSIDRGENDVENREEEKQIGTTGQTVKSTEQGGRNSSLPAGAAVLQKNVQGGLNIEIMLEAEVKEEMKDTLAASEGGDILEQSMDRSENDVENREEEKQIGTTWQTVNEQGGSNSSLPAGAALLQEDVVYGKNGIEKYDEGYLEQEKLILDMLQGIKVKDELDKSASITVEIQKQRKVEEEERLEELVEGVAETMKLNVDDSVELEGRDIFLAAGDDDNYGFVERSAENEIDEGMLARNDLNEEAKNETQGGTLQAGADYGQNMVEKHDEKPKELVHDSVQRGSEEDIGKYFLVEDVLPMEGIEVRNEKLITEDKNAEPALKMRKVIVKVSGDKKTGGGGREDVKEGKKSEKVVLVAKNVKEEAVGNMYIDNNEDQVRGATGLLENIGDESNSALVVESCRLSDDTDENKRSTKASVKSFKVIVKTDKEKADTSTSVNTKISTKVICRTFEEKVKSEDYVEPNNTLINLNAAREIADECGLDLFDYTAGCHYTYGDLDVSQENENIRRKTDDVADFPVLRVSTKLPESRYLNLLPEADPVPSTEELPSEEKIWQQIDALRAILGYSAPVHTRSIEEIKALYVFTGIEPPPSFDDASDDLVELNEKLRFLKSVVGVK